LGYAWSGPLACQGRILAGIFPECRLESRHGSLERPLHGPNAG
jgi:hypothetical protein